MNTVTKEDLCRAVRTETGFPLENIEEIINNFLYQLNGALKGKNRVEIRGFATFKVVKRKWNARNPRTGEKAKLRWPYRIKFSESELVKDMLNKGRSKA